MDIKKYNDWESINEEKMETETITVTVRKGSADNLAELLEYIKSTGNIGHSFSIVVDPDGSDYRKSFGWDGDGADYIESVKIND
jgi:hypothetical protein